MAVVQNVSPAIKLFVAGAKLRVSLLDILSVDVNFGLEVVHLNAKSLESILLGVGVAQKRRVPGGRAAKEKSALRGGSEGETIYQGGLSRPHPYDPLSYLSPPYPRSVIRLTSARHTQPRTSVSTA